MWKTFKYWINAEDVFINLRANRISLEEAKYTITARILATSIYVVVVVIITMAAMP